ncbi:small multi-drug export protein [Bogoriella caseilytica]|uniref:Putative small multi-drug export protein n=1 Tax=Bogoriella caseilytica TaxID=56055 RepID=A0A3N2BG07_9MICO|nr:small multi-drug export protein [Bogoriella caseilytica]ROR74148.1 putative small multi-drug export protein [Bogoriella caseilytica]
MSGADLTLLGGVFLGGAIPWLEAIIVVPLGILAGGPPALVVLAGVTGNLLTLAAAAWFGERVRNWVRRRTAEQREARGQPREGSHTTQKRQQRIERIMTRWGMPGLAVLGPLGLGTQVSAVVAVAAGVRAGLSFTWIAAGTIVWSIVAAVLAAYGVSFLGIGAG